MTRDLGVWAAPDCALVLTAVTAVAATAGGPVVGASTVPAARRRHRSGFWAAALAFLIVMAVATLPSPFAVLVGLGVAFSGWALLGHRVAGPHMTGRRNEMSSDFAVDRVQEVHQ